MNEEDLMPFDWDAYKAGNGTYYIYNPSRGFIECAGDLGKVENKDGSVRYLNFFLSKLYLDIELRLIKPKKENYVAFQYVV